MRYLLFLLGVLFPASVFPQGVETVFYVSPLGKPGNPGTPARPFATAQQARDAIRKVQMRNPEQAFTVFFREGTYFLTEALELTAADSGSVDFPVRYAAYRGETVVFYGGRRLDPAAFHPVTDPEISGRLLPEARGQVLEIDLKKAGINNFGTLRQHGFGTIAEPAPLELFIDGERQTLARYPNEGILPIGRVYDKGSIPRQGDFSGRGAEFGYEYDRPKRWAKAQDLWLHGHFSFGYADDHLPVAAIDTLRRVFRTAVPHIYGVYSTLYADTSKWVERVGLSMRGYYAYNLPEEIDQPGEWYLDRRTGRLFLYPPAGFDRSQVEVSLLETPFIRLLNTARIRIENIQFRCARGMGIYLENAHDIAVEGCRFDLLGTVAISAGQPLEPTEARYTEEGAPALDRWISEQFRRLTIRNCRGSRTGTGGIILTGGDRRSLRPAENTISHCTFDRVDERNHSYAPAVKLFGVGTTVDHCLFQDIRHMALNFMGNEHRITHNRFERICTDTDDMAAIYTGRDPSARGTVIENNHFRDIRPRDAQSQVGAVFIDDGSGGIEIAHNWFERCGSRGDEEMFGCIALHGGFDNRIHHNLFEDCEVAVGNNYWTAGKWKTFLESPLMQQRLHRAVDISSAVYQEKYPALRALFAEGADRLNYVSYNFFIGSNTALQGRLELDHNKMPERRARDQVLEKIGFRAEPVGPKE